MREILVSFQNAKEIKTQRRHPKFKWIRSQNKKQMSPLFELGNSSAAMDACGL